MVPVDLPSLFKPWRVKPGTRVKLRDYDPGWAGSNKYPKADRRRFAETLLSQDVTYLSQQQEILYAADSWSVLIVLQAMDAAGKDGLIKHVMSGVNPSGCQVSSFKQPSAKELDHNYLWRYSLALPERGRIGIFNRSYYEEVLVVRVHPEWIRAQRIPEADPEDHAFWQARFDDINAFEQHLTRNGTLVLKFFLHVSKETQEKRLLKRLNDPKKHWKFSAADLKERAFWDDYMRAYESLLSETSTEHAPWHIIPADHKWVTRALVAQIVARAIEGLALQYPRVTPEQARAIEEARAELEIQRRET